MISADVRSNANEGRLPVGQAMRGHLDRLNVLSNRCRIDVDPFPECPRRSALNPDWEFGSGLRHTTARPSKVNHPCRFILS